MTVINTFSASIILLMDAANPDGATRRHAIDDLRMCFASLDAMRSTWLWSERAMRALRLLADEWHVPHALPATDSPFLPGTGEQTPMPMCSINQPTCTAAPTALGHCPDLSALDDAPLPSNIDWTDWILHPWEIFNSAGFNDPGIWFPDAIHGQSSLDSIPHFWEL